MKNMKKGLLVVALGCVFGASCLSQKSKPASEDTQESVADTVPSTVKTIPDTTKGNTMRYFGGIFFIALKRS